jgi:hypothetical protein
VRAALRAAAERSAFVRRLADACACRDSAKCDAARRGIRFNARRVARARVFEVAPVRREALRLAVLRFGAPRLDELLRFALALRRLVVLRVDDELRFGELRLFVVLRLGAVLRFGELRLFVVRRLEAALDFRGLRVDFPADLRYGFLPIFTPARRASESPIAMACFAFFAPCSPPRILSISPRTNSPACVLADLPARLSFSARSMVSLSGMGHPKSVSRTLARAMNVPR